MTSFADAPQVKKTAEQVVAEQFFTAQTGRSANESDKALAQAIHEKVVALALLIEIDIPAGRNKSLAKTALEDVQMRAIRAIFSPVG
ncbi:hypothetical protein SEA_PHILLYPHILLY_29 [Microbacterium phage PhillyPhilly]|nr:hypothetical protein SEA_PHILLYPHILLY_29 [Microbacterium phage PhillyPhilly]